MEQTLARASLAGSVAAIEGPPITTTILASDIEAALRDDAELDLVLDLVRTTTADGEQHSERRRVAVEWERNDLERLLGDVEGDTAVLAFDAASLDRAFSEDVEGHGVRETAAAFGVLAALAAGSAQQASAALADRAAIPGDPGPASVRPDDRADRGSATVAGTPTRPDDQAVRVSPTGAEQAVRPDDRAIRGPAGTPTGIEQATRPDDRSAPRPTPVAAPAPAGDGIEITGPSPGEAVLLGAGIALAIAGAAFLARTRRPAQPA